MKTELLDYELPEALIAQEPTPARDESRMLVLGTRGVEHRIVREFGDLVPAGALVVLNDTRVQRARLLGTRRGTGGKAEIFLLEKIRETNGIECWRALGRMNRPMRPGMIVDVGSIEVSVVDTLGEGMLIVELCTREGVELEEQIELHGRMPLPPYIRREENERDAERYQTIFAKAAGAVAAPTAGLHLTDAMLARLRERGVEIGFLTLHVGLGTFRPVTAGDLDEHAMHAESFAVSAELAALVGEARRRGAPVVAVGTTVVRALESAADPGAPGQVTPFHGSTRLLIQPGFRFRVVDALLTNFHMPRSTLLALVAAFTGLHRLLEAYRAAIEHRYRFLSYGDAMWIPERAG